MSLFPEMRAGNRLHFSRCFEVYLQATVDVLAARDTKGLYGAALRGEREHEAGADLQILEPAAPDLVIDAAGPLPDFEALAAEVLRTAGGIPS